MTVVGRALSYFGADGLPIRLGEELGRGGEGAVYDITSQPQRVAKIYLSPIESQKEDKLRAMVSQSTEALSRFAAWPADLVLDQNRQVAGLIMRKITGYLPIHELYTPKSRMHEFPKANWAFLVHAATNIARAFATMHSHNVIIGDVNHGNVLVNDKGVCALIDCDSFQVTSNGHRFLCEVGVSTFTPPELQGKDFATVARTESHDNFGLALLVFHLLLMGRHPFAGRFLGSGEMPVERAIRECRFAFSWNCKALQMAPPPNSLTMSDLPPEMAALFEHAFSGEAAHDSPRPRATAWIDALTSLSNDLAPCSRNPCHLYYRKLPKCPWCRLEEVSAIIFFMQLDVPRGLTDFKIEPVWARIMAVPPPGTAPALDLRPPATAPVACEEAKAAGKQRWKKILLGAGVAGAGFIAAIVIGVEVEGAQNGEWPVLLMIGISIFLATRVWKHAEKSVKFRAAYEGAAARYESLEDQWYKETSEEQFIAKRMELQEVRKELESLAATYQERKRFLETNRKQVQLQKWLDRHYIRTASIPGIGAGRKALLASYGIDTAADLNWLALGAVDGIGPHYSTVLMQWRNSVEAKFVFNPRMGVDPQELAKLNQQITSRRIHLQQRLGAGIPELQIIRERTIAKRTSLQQGISQARAALLQAKADLSAC